MDHRIALASDLPLLARLNRELVEDEGHANRMTEGEFEARMRDWLSGEYTAVLFEDAAGIVGYAVYRPEESGVYLRQFYIARNRRRQGCGRAALRCLHEHYWASDTGVSLEVLLTNERAISFWRAMGFENYAITMRMI